MAADSNIEQRLLGHIEREENLIIKDMFLDLPGVKKEVFNYYDNEFESTPVSVQHEDFDEDIKPPFEEADMTSKTIKSQCAFLPIAEHSGKKLLKCNKIILGSKPNRVSVDEDELQKSPIYCESNDVSVAKGSNLNRDAVNENYFEELFNCCRDPNVVLQDIQSYLHKSKRFCDVCSILFPEPSGYDSHVQIYHTNKDIADNSHKANDIKKRVQYKCTICAKSFVAGHVLRRHLKNIHKANETKGMKNNGKHIDSLKRSFNNFTDFSNTCFHCKKAFKTQKSLIEHLYDILHMKRKETEIVPVLKSVLFKCHKCDINFTSSQFAAEHAEHMEMLVNWKCGICNRIFKKEDELSHERQHSVSNHFVEHNLGDIDVSKILFQCPKCSVHFSESNFLYHFRDCGLEVTKSVHCKICDILLDYNTSHESGKHAGLNSFTIIRTDVISDNPVKSTVKERTDVISDNPDKSIAKEIQTRNKLTELQKSFREVKVVLQKIDSSKLNLYCIKPGTDKIVTCKRDTGAITKQKLLKDKHRFWRTRLSNIKKTGQKYKWNSSLKLDNMHKVVNGKRSTNADAGRVRKMRAMTYLYCDTCKCFITNFRKDVHKTGNCKKTKKYTCKLCGLILTRNSLNTHNRLHESRKDLQLKTFRFCNLLDGRPMNPPVPEYPECSICAVRFVSKAARKKHICEQEAYLSCNICDTKLSEAAFKLHMMFHHYAMDTMNMMETKLDACTDQCTIPLDIEETARNTSENEIKLPQPPDEVDMTMQNSSDRNSDDPHAEVDMPMPSSSSHTKPDDLHDEVDMPLPNSISDTDLRDSLDEIDNQSQNSSDTELHHPLGEVDIPSQNTSSNSFEIMYTCGNCSISVDTYDKAIEHCQEHYINEAQDSLSEICTNCNLKIDKTCYIDHYNLHKKGRDFEVLKFDSYYLPAENDLWIKHIFKTVPNEKVVNILNQSIYRFECRIKMDVIQQGDPFLTMYKCDQCSCFIEPNSLFEHSENSCFKLRQHICAHCGLPFISSASRIEHEKIHSRPGVTMDSYRIVVFNREQDKQINRSFCLRKNYVLYKCRFCDVIIDKLQSDIHQCDFINVKKCSYCSLLLHNMEYEKHITKHNEFASFNYSNMKVIILGEDKTFDAPIKNPLKSTYKGAIYDYKMYICNKCNICIKNEKCMPKHICNFETQRSKCFKCGLYFSVGRLKTHTRSHERDPDFLRCNMNIVTFDPCSLDQNKNATLKFTEECELSDSNTESDSDDIMAADNSSACENSLSNIETTETIEEIAKIFKCPCALHFLNEDSIFRHFGVCKSKAKISRQKCPNCDLTFTTNILFTHLLAHHSNKSRRYKYNIIEMDNAQISMLQK